MGSVRDVGRNDVADTVDGMGTVEARRLIRGAGGAGWTSVEALRPEDGLALWAYEPRRLLNAVACGAGTVFVSTRVAHAPERDREDPADIVALRASDGVALWRMQAEQLRWRLMWPRVACGMRVAFGQFSLTSARRVVRSLRLAGRLSLTADGEPAPRMRWAGPVRL